MNERLSVAAHTDAGDVAALVNRAYRPERAVGGWTHEADWIRGPRTTVPQVLALMKNGAVILRMLDASGGLMACVHVSVVDATTCIGLLATDPARQGIGLGSRMLDAAEQCAATRGMPRTAKINVLDCRSELIAFYERRGYQRTGVVHPYPLAGGFGSPVVDGISVVEMTKAIAERPEQSGPQSCTCVRDKALASQFRCKNVSLQQARS